MNYVEGRGRERTEGRKYVWPEAMCSSVWIRSEGEEFHVTARETNYRKEECADTHLNLGEACGISAEAELLYTKGPPTARHPVVILNTSCELLHLCLSP
jgi:hypothetical protein